MAVIVVRDGDCPVAGRYGPRLARLEAEYATGVDLVYVNANSEYGITFTKPAPRERWLRDALDEVLAGEKVAGAGTPAEGCYLDVAAVPLES